MMGVQFFAETGASAIAITTRSVL